LRFIENQDKNKSLNQDPVYEQLGFKNNLNFKARSELREECKRFLRFAFLLDFIALESLSKIFLNSINDCIDKLQLQVSTPVSCDLEVVRGSEEKEKEQLKKPRQEVDLVPDAEAQVPLFLADCLYREVEIPAHSLYTASIDPFILPPIGKSRMMDFNPMVHLEIEPEPRDSDDDEAAAQPAHYTAKTEDSFDAQNSKLEVTKVKNIHELWLNVYPDKHVLASLIMETFKLGFDSLKNFERWSMHADLKPYDQVLEHWDYRCYERWEPPQENELYLNCDDWIVEHPAYQHLEENVEILINKGMDNVTQQFEQLELILHDYWINQQLGDFSAVLHERLKNPVELLPILLKRFVDQKDEF
jgi:dynein heavy chain